MENTLQDYSPETVKIVMLRESSKRLFTLLTNSSNSSLYRTVTKYSGIPRKLRDNSASILVLIIGHSVQPSQWYLFQAMISIS